MPSSARPNHGIAVSTLVTSQPPVLADTSAPQYRQRPSCGSLTGAPQSAQMTTAPEGSVKHERGRWNSHRSAHRHSSGLNAHVVHATGSVTLTSKTTTALSHGPSALAPSSDATALTDAITDRGNGSVLSVSRCCP
jgi:hypothetical protein